MPLGKPQRPKGPPPEVIVRDVMVERPEKGEIDWRLEVDVIRPRAQAKVIPLGARKPR